jgi:MSHA pilin protein MshD
MCTRHNQRGISLIELIMFIVIVSVALAGILLVMNMVTGHSSDALQRKQALAIAESLLEEVELMPFTICDPDDPNAASAVSAASCTGLAGGPNDESKLPLGPETAASVGGAEGRYAAPQFDNVNDYNGFTMLAGAGIRDITNTAIAGLNGYAANIVVAQAALGVVPAAASLRITVTVTAPDTTTVVLDGYRTRYAPNAF